MLDVVILTGPCGVGKSSVAFECMNVLEAARVPAAMIDGELAYVSPSDPRDPFAYRVAEAALRVLGPVYETAGKSRLLLARVVEDAEQLAIVERALPGSPIRILRLVARPETIRSRLRSREIGSGLAWHEQRSAEISVSRLGEPIDAERDVVAIAHDVLARVGWA